MKHHLLSPIEKLRIIEEVKYNGVISTCHKHGINPVSYYNWLKKKEESEVIAFNNQKKKRKDVYELIQENRQLKKEIEIKDKEIQKYLVLVDKKFQRSKQVNKHRMSVNF